VLARTPPPLILTPPERFPNEHAMQECCTQTILRPLLLPDVAWSAIDHGHSFDKRVGRHGVEIGFLEAKKRKRRGVEPGIPDYLLWHEGDSFAIELKMPDGDLSDDQRTMLKRLIRSGVLCRVCHSLNLVLNTLMEWHLTRGIHFGHNGAPA
jgi:hypothetical protein